MTKQQSVHDSFIARTRVKESSDRSFGLTVGIALAIIGGVRLYLHGLAAAEIGLFAVALLLIVTSLVAPRFLKPANRIWLKIGHLLFKIFSPVMMALIFALAIVPVGLLMQLFGKDSLHLKFDARAKTYWMEKDPPGPAPETMKYQF